MSYTRNNATVEHGPCIRSAALSKLHLLRSWATHAPNLAPIEWNYVISSKLVSLELHKSSYTRACQIVPQPFAKQMRVCVYGTANLRCAIWNDSHTVRHEPKFVDFWRKYKENWMRQVTFPCTGCPLFASKLMNHTPLMNHTQTVQCLSVSLVYTKL